MRESDGGREKRRREIANRIRKKLMMIMMMMMMHRQYTVPLCLDVRDPGIAELRSIRVV